MIRSKLLSSINHALVAKEHELNGLKDSIVLPKQMHSNVVAAVHGSRQSTQADGLVSNSKTPIGVVTADCVPILLYDPVSGIKSAVHAGWKGTLNEIAINAVDAIESEGGSRDNLTVAIGPAIKSCCYDIDEERTQLFQNKFGLKTVNKIDNKYYIDLQRINSNQLVSIGISLNQIEILEECTQCNPRRYYSYRRGDRDKRMISYIQ